MSNPQAVSHPTVSSSAIGLGSSSILGNLNDSLHHSHMNQFNTFHRRIDPFSLFDPFAATLKHPRTPRNPSFDYPFADSDHMSKRARLIEITEMKVDLSVEDGHLCNTGKLIEELEGKLRNQLDQDLCSSSYAIQLRDGFGTLSTP
ncbi:hypothetical protein L1987_41095 [Smallanthus sonchifolius]|uniref:Uncharacterized protein n=1 Tax=Smallanthus sonchifolius TaxID=185202 RepID=A0ACB9GTZ9_9ASTR|nr:hypothetical protein L1987_41095 [Smallanthus sonchifolius]